MEHNPRAHYWVDTHLIVPPPGLFLAASFSIILVQRFSIAFLGIVDVSQGSLSPQNDNSQDSVSSSHTVVVDCAYLFSSAEESEFPTINSIGTPFSV